MDDHTQTLAEQLKTLVDVPADEIAELMRRAQAEALAEAGSILKDAMLQAILVQVLDALESTADERTTNAEPGPAGGNQHAETDDAQIRQEIEAIRRQIAENNRLLDQAAAKPAEMSEAQTAPISDHPDSADKTPKTECGYYVYGVVQEQVDGLPAQGIDSHYPVYAMPYRDVWVIVSRVSNDEFNQETLEASVQDLDWLEEQARCHQDILTATMAGGSTDRRPGRTCIPMKFCTIYHSEERVREMLATHYADLLGALTRLDGKQEWGVTLHYTRQTLAQRAGEVSDEVKTLEQRIAAQSDGAAYFLKKQMESTVAREVERISDHWAQQSYDRLAAHAAESVINPLRGQAFTAQGETMILNSAHLVADEALPAFQAELESLKAECKDLGFGFRMTGPWPPYNFVDIGPPEEIAA